MPEVEWWDLPLLTHKSYDYVDVWEVAPLGAITNLIQHPIQIEPPTERGRTAIVPVVLTTKERKRLRRQRRMLEEQEKRDKIRMGLIQVCTVNLAIIRDISTRIRSSCP